MGIFSKFKKGAHKGSELLRGAIDREWLEVLYRKMIFLDLEEAIRAIFGPETTDDILAQVHSAHRNNKRPRGEDVRQIACTVLSKVLEGSEEGFEATDNKPEVICLIGVNGSGKTTTTAKFRSSFHQIIKLYY